MRSLEDIVPLLESRTDAGALRWHSQGKDRFVVEQGMHEFAVSAWFDQNAETSGYTLHLLRSDEVIDAIVADEYSPRHSLVESLFSSARRSAFDVPATISDLESELMKL